jgi:hypothetical protein
VGQFPLSVPPLHSWRAELQLEGQFHLACPPEPLHSWRAELQLVGQFPLPLRVHGTAPPMAALLLLFRSYMYGSTRYSSGQYVLYYLDYRIDQWHVVPMAIYEYGSFVVQLYSCTAVWASPLHPLRTRDIHMLTGHDRQEAAPAVESSESAGLAFRSGG